MKFLLVTLSVFLLTGCDNFQLLQSKSANDPKEFKIESKDTPPPSETPVAPEKVPAPTDPAKQPQPETDKKTPELEPKPAAPETKPAAPPKDEAKPEVKVAKPTLDITDYLNFLELTRETFGTEEMNKLTKFVIPKNVEKSDIKLHHEGLANKLTYKISVKDQTHIEFKDVKLNLSGANIINLNGFELSALCMGAKCDVIFMTISKRDEKSQLIENFPCMLKLIQGKYALVGFKDLKEYEADKKEQKTPKSIPQLEAIRLLREHRKAHGKTFDDRLKLKLQQNETLVYTDRILNHTTVKTKDFQPQFSRQDGKLILNAQIKYSTPKKPALFQGEIQENAETSPMVAEGGLTLRVIPVVDNIFALMITQTPYTSKIANIKNAFQTVVCSVVEEEKSVISNCVILKSSGIFGEGTVEASFKEHLKTLE